jgi:threonine/homoserine/homoserine lactone efflux protein
MFLILVQGIGLGFAGAVQPGPFQTYLISQTLKNGWKRTLPAALAPLISDPFIILLVLLVLSRVPASLQRALHLVSGLFILYLAWGAFASWQKARKAKEPSLESSAQSLLKAVIMNFISPGPYLYWSLVAGPTLLSAWRQVPSRGVGFLVGFYITLVGTFGAVIMVFGTARHLGPKVNRAMVGVSALALAGFGIYQLWLGLV